ncbi:O-antigen ligase family protein [Pseudoduganella danionis]|uniref:O-antigen ligase family protein n=1 Tax=Pseudoduganella danionis TaxID=1890295 RepID=UPI00360DC99C
MAELIKPMLILVAVWLLCAAVAQSEKPQRWVALVGFSIVMLPILVFLVAGLSGLSLREMATPAARTFLNATGLHANELAVELLPAYAAALFMFPSYRSLNAKIWGAAVMGATVLALVLTFSRAAFLGVILVTFAFFFLRGSYRYIFAGVLVFAVVAAVLPDSIIERATTGMGQKGTIGAHNDPLTAGRVRGIWLPLLPDVARHPILGDGTNSILWSTPARQGLIVEGHPHNAYLRLVKDHGIVGIPLIVYFLLQVWRLYRRLARDETQTPLVRAYFNGMSVALVVFFVQCMSGTRLIFELLHVFYWLAIAIGLGLEARKQRVAQLAEREVAPQWHQASKMLRPIA